MNDESGFGAPVGFYASLEFQMPTPWRPPPGWVEKLTMLQRRARYGGRKGRSARRRLLAMLMGRA